MEGSYTPVQFCTSPPLNVYKPRRSQSPPPKLFHLASNGEAAGPAHHTALRLVQGEQLDLAVFFWYLGKSDLSSVHVYSSVHWTSHFLQGTIEELPCLTGHLVAYVLAFFRSGSSFIIQFFHNFLLNICRNIYFTDIFVK